MFLRSAMLGIEKPCSQADLTRDGLHLTNLAQISSVQRPALDDLFVSQCVTKSHPSRSAADATRQNDVVDKNDAEHIRHNRPTHQGKK